MVEDGRSALLVPSGDAPAMAEAIAKLLDDRALACRLADAGYADVQQYGWPAVRARWLAIYERLDGGGANMTFPKAPSTQA